MKKIIVLFVSLFLCFSAGKGFAQEQPKVEDLLKQIKQLKADILMI